MAEYSEYIVAIDPDAEKIQQAKILNSKSNVTYSVGTAEKLPAEDQSYDVVIFTLSLHHVTIDNMNLALDEAIRIVKKDGHIIFFEPAFSGSFFEAEFTFEACDGDERAEKAAAYACMLSHPDLEEIVELHDETVFHFDSVEDFNVSMNPLLSGSKNDIRNFLELYEYTLRADRRINIFQPRLDETD